MAIKQYARLEYMPQNKETGESQGQGKEKLRRPSYLDTRRYPTLEEAGRSYHESQESIRRDRTSTTDLSVYRVLVGPSLDAHIVVLGDTPKKELLEKLERALGAGERVELADDVLEDLLERREAAKRTGPWVESHLRFVKPVRMPRRRR